MGKEEDFMWSTQPEPHAQRRREMLQKYPQIKSLMRHEPLTKYVIFFEVSVQILLAYLLRDSVNTFVFWFVAYFVGGTITSIHEITHYLAFKSFLPNKILACIANIPIILPFCVEFKRYHMDHHRFQGVDGIDGDLPTRFEAALFNNFFGKLFFCSVQILFYATPKSYKVPSTLMGWIFSWHAMNFVIQVPTIALVAYYWGPGAIVYLAVSILFGGSLHPMAGHFIAEHYVRSPNQETFSYYGPLNLLAFNVGYHNEHHDFPNIPWTLLPKLREIAPEYYDLAICKSWTWTIIDFICSSNFGPYNRIKRSETAELPVAEVDSKEDINTDAKCALALAKED